MAMVDGKQADDEKVNVLNDEEDKIGRHNGFEKRTFGYVAAVKGKKKNITNAYGPKDTVPARSKRIKSGGRKRNSGARKNTKSTMSSGGASSGHLSINALKSLLGGSSGGGGGGGGGRRVRGGSDVGVIPGIPGTPGVLARAMHSHNARVEQEEDAMYDYSNGGGIGGIGLGGFGNVQYEEPS
jgi:hypothetical protein